MRLNRLGLLFLLLCSTALAQDIRYVSDKQYVPLRSGAGNDYRIVHRGIPSGTRLKVARTTSNGEWSEITTDSGTTGWIRSQYLMSEIPAQVKLDDALARATNATGKSAALAAELDTLKLERTELLNQVSSSSSDFNNVSQELNHLKQISGKAVQLDEENRRLVEESENLRSEVETLKAENQRLLDKIDSEDFLNGVLAVLLGVVIALVAPRLVPKRRRNSEWA